MSLKHKTLLVIVSLIVAFCIYMQCISGVVGDKDSVVNLSTMWLQGRPLYEGVFSALPPLIIWLYAIPVALAKLLPLSDALLLPLLVLGACSLSITLCVSLISRLEAFAGDLRKRTEFTLLLVFMFTVWSHALYFGDREHIFFVLVFPYLLRFMPSLCRQSLPRRTRIVIGCMAGIGFCIKPHCILIFAGVQLLALLQSRYMRILWSVENAIIYICGVGYLASVALFVPEYYSIVLPMTLATYSAASDPKAPLFYGAVAFVLAGIQFADFRLRDASPHRRDILYFTGLSFAFLLYALTNNGWGYTWNPLDEMILFTGGFILWQYRFLAAQTGQTVTDVRRFRFGTSACLFSFTVNTLIVLVLYGASYFVTCDQYCRIDADMKQLVERKNARSFGSLSFDFHHPATLRRATQARMETRFNHLWMLPKFLLSDAVFHERNQWILDYVARAYAQDLEKRKPELMFVDDMNMIYRTYRPVDLIAYLSFDESFRAAWSHYRFLSSINYCTKSQQKQDCKYDIYERIKE